MGVPQYPYMGVRWHPCMGAQVALLALPPHSRRGCKELFVILYNYSGPVCVLSYRVPFTVAPPPMVIVPSTLPPNLLQPM